MPTPAIDHDGAGPLGRRSILKLTGVGLAGALFAAAPSTIAAAGGPSANDQRRRTQRVMRKLLDAIASGDLARMWSFFDCGGVVSQPFTGTVITDFAAFQDAFAGFFSVAQGLAFSNISFIDQADPNSTIATYNGHALITSTGRPYDQTYITRIQVRGDKVMQYTEYFDTFVLYSALGLLDPPTT